MADTLRNHGITFGVLPTTPHNHIADIAGVGIGHETIHREDHVHTGVTMIKPHAHDTFKHKAFAGYYQSHGHAKVIGANQIKTMGTIETYLGVTTTLAAGLVAHEINKHHIKQYGDEILTINPFVAECNDLYLNNSNTLPITPNDIHNAISNIKENNFAQGAIGAGTGMRTFSYKGGFGSAARVISKDFTKLDKDYTLGVYLLSNFGGFLQLKGKDIWQEIGGHRFADELQAMQDSAGSAVILVATDAPLLPNYLEKIAKRACLALTKTGSFTSMFTGDYALAWSTHADAAIKTNNWSIIKPTTPAPTINGSFISDYSMDPFFQAVTEATEEAFWNSVTMSEGFEGYRGEIKSITVKQILEALKK